MYRMRRQLMSEKNYTLKKRCSSDIVHLNDENLHWGKPIFIKLKNYNFLIKK